MVAYTFCVSNRVLVCDMLIQYHHSYQICKEIHRAWVRPETKPVLSNPSLKFLSADALRLRYQTSERQWRSIHRPSRRTRGDGIPGACVDFLVILLFGNIWVNCHNIHVIGMTPGDHRWDYFRGTLWSLLRRCYPFDYLVHNIISLLKLWTPDFMERYQFSNAYWPPAR